MGFWWIDEIQLCVSLRCRIWCVIQCNAAYLLVILHQKDHGEMSDWKMKYQYNVERGSVVIYYSLKKSLYVGQSSWKVTFLHYTPHTNSLSIVQIHQYILPIQYHINHFDQQIITYLHLFVVLFWFYSPSQCVQHFWTNTSFLVKSCNLTILQKPNILYSSISLSIAFIPSQNTISISLLYYPTK